MLLFIGIIGDFIMKITKSYLKQIIKEELTHLEVAEGTEKYPTHPALQGGPNTVEEAIANMQGAIRSAKEATRYPNTMGQVIEALSKVEISFSQLRNKLEEQKK